VEFHRSRRQMIEVIVLHFDDDREMVIHAMENGR
jgi:hypothetical protein